MRIRHDGKDQPFIQWEQFGTGHFKRAWIQRKTDADKNWAGVSRYLNVVRCNADGTSGGNPTDFPIHDSNDLPDEQILRAFVHAACAITGCAVPEDGD